MSARVLEWIQTATGTMKVVAYAALSLVAVLASVLLVLGMAVLLVRLAETIEPATVIAASLVVLCAIVGIGGLFMTRSLRYTIARPLSYIENEVYQLRAVVTLGARAIAHETTIGARAISNAIHGIEHATSADTRSDAGSLGSLPPGY